MARRPEQGIRAETVQHDAGAPAAESTGEGVYCFGGLGFDPTSAVATIDNTDSLPAVPSLTGGSLNFISTVAVFKGETSAAATPPTGRRVVAIQRVDETNPPTLANHGFFIWFEE